MGWKEKVYLKLPIFVQDALLNHHGKKLIKDRYNSNFKYWLKEYHQHDSFSETDLLAFQKNEIRAALKNAVKSPYWNKIFQESNINIDGSNSIDELKKLPIMSKHDARKYNDSIFIAPVNEKLEKHQTSGTTGGGLYCPENASCLNKQWAIWWRYRNRLGIDLYTWCGWFGGKHILPADVSKPPYWKVNTPGKQLMFSPIHLSEKTALLYYNKIKESKLTWLHGYPSQLTFLTQMFIKAGLTAPKCIKIITTGAENLLDSQRALMQDYFKVPVCQHYGLAERVANISELPDGTMVEDKSFAYIEYIPVDGLKNTYRLVGTNFSNLVFPLFRYDTGDLVKLDDKKNIISIEGRQEDYLSLPDGGRLGPFNLIMKSFNNVVEAQMVMTKEEDILIRVVKGEKYTQLNESQIINAVKERMTSPLNVKVEYTDKLPRTKRGKLKAVIDERT